MNALQEQSRVYSKGIFQMEYRICVCICKKALNTQTSFYIEVTEEYPLYKHYHGSK